MVWSTWKAYWIDNMYKSVSKCNLTENELVVAPLDMETVMNNLLLNYVADKIKLCKIMFFTFLNCTNGTKSRKASLHNYLCWH